MKEGKGFKFIFDLHFWTDGPDRQEKDKGNSNYYKFKIPDIM